MSQLEALALTLVVELAVALAFARGWGMAPRALGWLAAAVVAASLLTHPLAWWSNGALMPHLTFWPRAALIEVGVAVAETAVLGLAGVLSWRRAAVVAWVMNAVSFGLGVALQLAARA